MWRIAGTVRAKKIRQDGVAEFISTSLIWVDHFYGAEYGRRRETQCRAGNNI